MLLSRAELKSESGVGATMNQQCSNTSKRQRALIAVGPGDVVTMYRELLDGNESSLHMYQDFSKLVLDWCIETGTKAHLLSWHTRREVLKDGPHVIENWPKSSLYYRGGLSHYVGEFAYGVRIVWKAIRERHDVVVVDSGTTHWIVFSLLSAFSIPVIAVMHNSLWPAGYPPKRFMPRLLRSLDGFFFRHFAAATICVSPECERQVRKVAGTPKGRIYQCRGQYRLGIFDHLDTVPTSGTRPFRVLFMGRVEESKGVFMILSMAERLEQELPGQFVWKIVGGGGALEPLRKEAKDRKLSQVTITGMLSSRQLVESLSWCHAMVAPTTSRFSEGFALTAAEAVLAGRPVVLSRVVPAWEVLGGAAIVAQTEDVDSFVSAFRRLLLDPNYYDECQRATIVARAQFYDESMGLGVVLGHAISDLGIR
jgi:glycogen synthase